MSLFQRVFDDISKGYWSATEKASPSVDELNGMRQRMVTASNDTTVVRSQNEQVELRRDLSEVDSMIERANKIANRKAVQPAPV